ncbi:G5 domain-containing protein [Rathayibacter sp. VKM Ac-2856]|uniref:G5 domain-containing protein n=1 Tax=unclassified Rathayibacter TaxID=2609250 RepID=UPI001562F87D|nr:MULTISPECIES: G5 domain-containing protein [unclassified Rathayibacter]NQX04362.1 G5 domain-containing protein [Rathayibacter sp. VKM Ac-2858]NQX19531.1 G5 domain-containing protein [Rathayibacter sp. VKM Ac-2856]
MSSRPHHSPPDLPDRARRNRRSADRRPAPRPFARRVQDSRPADVSAADRSPSGRRPLRAGSLRLTRLRLTPLQWVVGGITAFLALVAWLTGGPWSALIMVALVVLITAAYGVLLRRPTWLGLPRRRRASAMTGAAAMLVLVLSTSALGSTTAPAPADEQAVASGTESPASFAAAPTRTTTPTPTPTPTRTVVITTETVTETVAIPRSSRTEDDPGAAQGTSTVIAGVDGVLTRTVEVVKHDGAEVSRSQLSESVTTPPVDDVTRVGTLVPAPAPVAEPAGAGCHSSYAGECVPIASDGDCAAGSGNGPVYILGPVTVVGPDDYDLDNDGDGIACDA